MDNYNLADKIKELIPQYEISKKDRKPLRPQHDSNYRIVNVLSEMETKELIVFGMALSTISLFVPFSGIYVCGVRRGYISDTNIFLAFLASLTLGALGGYIASKKYQQ